MLEVTIDVNPIFDKVNKTFSWSYEIVGTDVRNSGGIYLNNETEYQTAVLKGIFKGLKVIVDNNLTKKKIILKCNYDGILSDKMKSTDENKSRMKTINALIENDVDVDDIETVKFSEKDVVRHKLVQSIIRAYEKAEQKPQRTSKEKNER